MSAITLYTGDLARGAYSYIHSSTTGFATAANALDGDPSNQWALGTTAGNFIWGTGGSYTVKGVALGNHNLKDGSFSVYHGPAPTGPWTLMGNMCDVATHDDVVYYPAAGFAASDAYFKVAVSGPSNILIGTLSLLHDYGYNASGVQISTGGAVFPLVNEANLGVLSPLRHVLESGVSRAFTAGNVVHQLRRFREIELIELQISMLRGSANNEWWRLRNSYRYPTNSILTNPNWHKGLWLTLQNYDATSETTRQGVYCCLEEPPAWEEEKDDRVSGVIRLRELGKG